jgi:uncharacterized protein (TIGR02271 family)
MSSIERSIEVDVPVSTAYNQWTMFEEFPKFMQGVEEVRQLDDKRMHWRAEIGFKDKEWDAEVVEQVPDRLIAWQSVTGAPNGGVVTFQPISADRTNVTLRIDYEPQGFLESIGDSLGFVSSRVDGDLRRFKEYIESRGAESGGWRGEIHGGQQTSGSGGFSTAQSSQSMGSVSGQSFGTTASAGSSQFQTGSNVASTETGEVAIPVVEEQINVGKREVESGGVRVNTRVEETPVQEQVNLRDEQVSVQRRAVDRPASEVDFQQQGTLEVRERDEQAVVAKEARVVEEVVVSKDVAQRTETIQDTVRRTDVDIEETGGHTRSVGLDGTNDTLGGTGR